MSFRSAAYPRKREAPLKMLSPSIHWAQYHQRTPHFEWSRRIYDFEFLYVQQGDILSQIGEEEYLVTAGKLLYIPSGVFHSIQVVTEPNASFLGVHFDFFDELDIKKEEDIIVNENNVNEQSFCFEPEFDDLKLFADNPVQVPEPHVITLIENLIHEFTEKKSGYEIICKGHLLQILVYLLRTQDIQDRKFNQKYGEQILDLAHRLGTNYADDWTGEKMACLVNIHSDYVSRLFKEMIGLTPNKYLQSIRHQQAKKLLRETDWKMEVIAADIGYSDVHYFSRLFHKCEGMTARDYRNLSRVF
jgi:AraC-like DNA-binding protein/quercetin dioxygenase-like cupin family protein